jgi:hypothetical protein
MIVKYNRKKRIIEIYFVLYLAALILLIPSKKDEHINNINDSGNKVFQLPFSLKSEKTALNAMFNVDSSGIKIISIDSLNTIYYTGNVKNVKFEFEVEDKSLRQNYILNSENKAQSKFFQFVENTDYQSATFKWLPPLNEIKNRTFLVTVTAKAISKDSATYGSILEDKLQFGINISFITGEQDLQLIANSGSIPINNQNNPATVNQPLQTQIITQSSNVFLIPREEVVKSIAYSKWENEITIIGLSPKDLRKQPEIRIFREPNQNIGGSAKILGFTDNTVKLGGESPGYGSMKIIINMIRHSDGYETSCEYKVTTELIDEPKFESVMYPGIKYIIEPKMPILSNQKLIVNLIGADGRIYASSTNGGTFSFTPSLSDTGKTVYLTRLIDGNLYGQKYTIKINYYPKPEITRVAEQAVNQVRIYTNSFGIFNNSENLIQKIEIIEGSIKWREIIGAQQAPDYKQLIYKQVFEITPSDNGKPLRFKIRVVSDNGLRSEVVNFPRN